MRNPVIPALALALALLSTSACGSGDTNQDPDILWGKTFKSTDIKSDNASQDLMAGTTVSLTFDVDGGRIRVRGDCNSLGGPVSIDEHQITLKAESLTSTMIGCRGDGSKRDDWITKFFIANPVWKFADHKLQLSTKESKLIFTSAKHQ